jgi:class 3 adenylate cyclase/tetratricopeptide (TPR) repeat protein
MHCHSCGFDNPDGLKFCGECGTPLMVRCPACGCANPPRFKFCGECGASLGPSSRPAPPPRLAAQPQPPSRYTPAYLAEKILTSKSALEGERKQVTVLFADLKASMELLADRDPEEARQLLDPVLERMMAAVHRYEGTVNQVMGDGIMALFGAPIAHEDHAVRACYAALAIQASIKQYAAEVERTRGVPLHIRVGLNSGEVVVRSIGSDLHMDYTAVGQTTHLAGRMEQMAMPGSILITADVLHLVEGYVQVNPLGPVPIKGLLAPVEVYEVTAAGPVRSRLQAAAARGLPRFVGRDTELDQLRQAFERAGAGQGQVVAVIGEPGVGKSRLFWEFTQSHRTQGWLILESRAASYGKATAYLPVCDLLKTYCHIEDRDDLRTVRAKITGQILTLDGALQDTVSAVLALFDALPADSPFLQLDPLQRRRRTLEALKRILLRESQVQPLLLVFEDLHWIDTETQAVLDLLVESLPTARVLLLVNYRPEYRHGWGNKTFYTQLRLDPLPPASAEELLHTLLGDDPSLEPLRPRLIAQTQGNPFFLEESVRTLLETGVLVGARGACRLGQPLDTLQVPDTVQALLAARIDRLPPEDKRLLQTAAVIGTEVPWPLLQAIADTSDEALYWSLGHLQAAEFLYEAGLFPERAYTFKHALTHEVAYSSLLHERRRALHARLVEALEALAGDRLDDQVERLALHALRGEVSEKALAYGRQAGDKARTRSAYREAVVCYEQALSALQHLPETRDTRAQAVDLRLALRSALQPSGDYQRILTYLREAEALAVSLDDRHRLGQVLGFLADQSQRMGAYHQAIAAAERMLALAAAGGEIVLPALANLYLGNTYLYQGDHHRALACLRQTMAALKGVQHRELLGQVNPPAVLCRAHLAWCHAELGTFPEGRALGEDGLRIAEAAASPVSVMYAAWGIGLLALRQGDLPRAIPSLERAVDICRDVDLPNYFPRVATTLGAAYALCARIDDAVPLLERGLEQALALERVNFQAFCRLPLGEAQLLAGHPEEAQALAERALVHAREHQERGHQAYALRLLGDIATHRDPSAVEEAEAYYRQALTLADELGMRPLQAHCHRGLGMLYAKVDQREQARTELSAAITMYRAMDMTFWLPQAEAALAQVEGR